MTTEMERFWIHLRIVSEACERSAKKVKNKLPCTREHLFEDLRDDRFAAECAKKLQNEGQKSGVPVGVPVGASTFSLLVTLGSLGGSWATRCCNRLNEGRREGG